MANTMLVLPSSIIISNKINRIPFDVIREIILPFTYNPQKKELLEDIRSFYIDYNIIDNYYAFDYNYRVLYNDLKRFYRNKVNAIARVYGVVPERISKIRMLLQIRIRCRLSRENGTFIYDNTESNIRNCVRGAFALLTPIERTQFINEFILEF
jgi:hypothetical protein